MFRTTSGQTGSDAYSYELAAIRNSYRELNERFARLAQHISAELPDDASGHQSIASEAFPDATMPVDAATYRRQLELTGDVDTFQLDQLRELLDSMDAYKPLNRPTELLDAARDFQTAADLLTEANAPIHVLADLVDEIDFLRTGDLTDLGTERGVERRYAAASRASRRQTIVRWVNVKGWGQPPARVQRALNAIGGAGA